ncbi:MAG: hypothetical protein MZV63_72465 [Marinilabiliales bacterium]|nr:hypothetical protein [Marinilabiliales bacterium]
MPIDTYKKNFKGTISFISVAKEGAMDIAFQLLLPGVSAVDSVCSRLFNLSNT